MYGEGEIERLCLINIILFINPLEAAEISYINLVSDSIFIVDDEKV